MRCASSALMRLTVEHGDADLRERIFTGSPTEISVGRDPSCGWPIAADDIHDWHAVLRWDGVDLWVSDFSGHGTWLDGDVLREWVRLSDGGRLQIGAAVIHAVRGSASTGSTRVDDSGDRTLESDEMEELMARVAAAQPGASSPDEVTAPGRAVGRRPSTPAPGPVVAADRPVPAHTVVARPPRRNGGTLRVVQTAVDLVPYHVAAAREAATAVAPLAPLASLPTVIAPARPALASSEPTERIPRPPALRRRAIRPRLPRRTRLMLLLLLAVALFVAILWLRPRGSNGLASVAEASAPAGAANPVAAGDGTITTHAPRGAATAAPAEAVPAPDETVAAGIDREPSPTLDAAHAATPPEPDVAQPGGDEPPGEPGSGQPAVPAASASVAASHVIAGRTEEALHEYERLQQQDPASAAYASAVAILRVKVQEAREEEGGGR